MSRVFVAEELSLERKVVVKVLPPDLAGTVDVERFRREIQLAAKLQHLEKRGGRWQVVSNAGHGLDDQATLAYMERDLKKGN